jgi:integrase
MPNGGCTHPDHPANSGMPDLIRQHFFILLSVGIKLGGTESFTVKEFIRQSIERTKSIREIATGVEYDGFVFPCPHTAKVQSTSRHALSRAIARNLEWPLADKNGKPLFQKDGKPATENRLGVDQFTPHDLRRTAATFMAQSGELDEVMPACLVQSFS